MKSRAQRRHDRERLLKKARKIFQKRFPNATDDQYTYWTVRGYNHLARCSCYACANRRKTFKGDHRLTRQEIKNELAFKEQLSLNTISVQED